MHRAVGAYPHVMRWPGLAAGCPPSRSLSLTIWQGGGENKMKKCLWIEIKTGRWLSNLPSQSKQTWLDLLPIKIYLGSEKQNRLPHSPHFFPQTQLHSCIPNSSTFPPALSSAGDMGNGGLQSVCNISTLLLLHPPAFLCSSMSSPWAAVLQDKPCPAWVLYGL